MLCVIDIGNTHTVLGIYREDALIKKWRMRTESQRTTDEWGLGLKNLFELANLDMKMVCAAALSSVVPQALHAITRACRRYFDVEPLVVGPGVKTGLAIRYESPKEVGADRVVNAVAAYVHEENACIIVDFGTATTFDCLSSKGEYLGGAIFPGIGTALEALVTHAAKLPRVEIAKPKRALGRNTVESMQSGVLFGYVALVDGLVARLASEMGEEPTVIATGGLASVIASESVTIERVEPDLTLEGLRLIYRRNKA
ncbi:MAG: type III pantothenate kinase [Myxococcota bacterium]|nr:type III pantothenate kinase [Myxococcota bacterium]